MRIRLALMTVLAMTGLAVSVAGAQPMAETVPADAVIYVGWQGSRNLGARAKGTHLESVLKSTGMPGRMQAAMDVLSKATAEKDPSAEHTLKVWNLLGEAAWRHPSALYVTIGEAGFSGPRGFVLKWKADDEAPALLAKVKEILAYPDAVLMRETMHVAQAGAYVVLWAGSVQEADATKEKPETAITENLRFKWALSVVAGKSCEAVFFFDNVALTEKVEKDVVGQSPEMTRRWALARDVLGVGGLRSVVWSGGFDGADWASNLFVEAPAPRKGLLELFDSPPVSQETLKLAPKSAVWVRAFQWDLAALADKYLKMAREIDPKVVEGFEGQVAGLKRTTQVDVMGLLGAVGVEWMLYGDQGKGKPGFVLVNRLRAPMLFNAQMALVEAQAAKMGARNLKLETAERNGLTIHSATTGTAGLSWTIRGDLLYVARTPESVVAAVGNNGAAGTILDKPEYQALMKRLGGRPAVAVTFADLSKTGPEVYQTFSLLGLMAGIPLAQQGVPNPLPELLPPLATITPDLAPAATVSWMDADGYHYSKITPFPGARLLGPDGYMAVSPGAMAVGIAIPAIMAARRTTSLMKSSAQIRGIHQSMVIYAQENGGKYPANAGELIDKNFHSPNSMLSPVNPAKIPAEFKTMTTEQKSQWLEANGAFVILRWGMKQEHNAKVIVGYLKPSSFPGGNGATVLWEDNHAEWVTPAENAAKMIQAQYPDHKLVGFGK